MAAMIETPLVDSDIDKIIERTLGTTDFHRVRWNLDRVGDTSGFLGRYFCLSVIIEISGETRGLQFFAKTPPERDSPQYEFLERFDIFNKEIIVYSDILVKMGAGPGIKWLPKYYLGKENEIIVLEDALVDGYANLDKYVLLDEEHLKWVIGALAIFHSRSLILDEKMRRSSGQTIQDVYGHLLGEVLFAEHEEWSQRRLASSIKGSCTAVDFADNLSEQQKTLVKERMKKWCGAVGRLLKPSTQFRNALCHRDVWSNNIMFKHDPQGKPIGCYLIDFQFISYSPPAYDFYCLLYSTTDKATRDRNCDRFRKIYYDAMRKEVEREGLNMDEIISWKTFLESCRISRQVALVYAVLTLQVMLLTDEAIAEHLGGDVARFEEVIYGDGRVNIVNHQCRVKPAFRSRMVEVVEEFWEWLPDEPPKL